MILENFTPAAIAESGELQASDLFVGDASEFAELTNVSISEMHNLTIALARVEHKCLVESNQELMEAGIKEFFAKAVETIKKWWNSFIAWLGSMWTKLKDVFSKREDWLKRNASAISGVSDDKLKGVKVSIGANIATSDFAGLASKAISEAKDAVGLAQHLSKDAVADSRSFIEKSKEKMLGFLKTRDMKKSVAKNIHDDLIGESSEVELNKGLVSKLLKVANDTFKAADQMKGAKIVADAAIKEAEGLTRAQGGERDIVNARVSYLRSIGPEVQALITGFTSAVSAANSQAMPALVKVVGLVGKSEEKKPEAKQEGTNVLAAFM